LHLKKSLKFITNYINYHRVKSRVDRRLRLKKKLVKFRVLRSKLMKDIKNNNIKYKLDELEKDLTNGDILNIKRLRLRKRANRISTWESPK